MRSLLALAALLVAASPAWAQQGPTALDSIAVNVNAADFGVAGDGSDDCLVLDTALAPTAGVQNFDLRLTTCQGFAAGSLVGDEATVEKGNPYPQNNGATAEGVLYADTNSNGRYDGGDLVYITSGPGFPSSQRSGTWSVRLTATPPALGGFSAGTLVFADDADHRAYAGTTLALPASITWIDNDGTGATFTAPDTAYLVPRTAGGLPAGSLIPLGSILLHQERLQSTSASSAPAAPVGTSQTSTEPADSSTSTSNAPDSTTTSQANRQTPAPTAGVFLLVVAAFAVRRRPA